MTMRTILPALMVPVMLLGCTPRQDANSRSSTGEGPTLSTLELDPADPIVIAGWWSNGRYLLEVEYDFRYQIRQGHYPESRVIERGRWTRKNHADFALEPYNVGKVQPERVALSLRKGVPVATIKGLAPFEKLSSPPRSLKEQLLGRWRGPEHQLSLKSEKRFSMKTEDEHSIEGTWTLERGSLILKPDELSLDPMVLGLERDTRGQVLGITGLGGPLTRVVVAPKTAS